MPPPPIPPRKVEEAKATPPPIPPGEGESPPPPSLRSAVRRPAGAVATVMASGLASGVAPAARRCDERSEECEDQQAHGNPYDLKAEPGSTVTASYPFRGEESLQQLSFAVGDRIKIKEKEEMWSWGILERGGKEGWFPHNYVGSTFKPLPGIHEMAAKLRERREKQDAEEARADASVARDSSTDEAGAAAESAPHPGTDGNQNSSPQPSATSAVSGAVKVSSDEAADSKSGAGDAGLGAADGTGDNSTRTDAQAEDTKNDAAADEATAASARATSPKPPNTTAAARMIPQQASAAPTLPPFSKGAPVLSSATAAPAQRAVDGDTSTAGPEQGTQIDGVGFEGTPPSSRTSCRCSIM